MLNTQALADKSAIGLSMLCALHCLLLPVAIILYPNHVSFFPDDKIVHFSILFIVIPISVFGLLKGAKTHKNVSIFIIGLFGLVILVAALLLGHSNLGDFGEKVFTLIGSLIVSFAHFHNFSICKAKNCECHNESN